MKFVLQFIGWSNYRGKTLLTQLSSGEILGDDFDVEEEVEATQAGGLIEMEAPTQTDES